jgi:hypothetical protein
MSLGVKQSALNRPAILIEAREAGARRLPAAIQRPGE